jgi:type I restriction enzyme M protein
MANNHSELEKRLWDAADDLRANSKLKSSEYSIPVLGLIFLRYADHKVGLAEKERAKDESPVASAPDRDHRSRFTS